MAVEGVFVHEHLLAALAKKFGDRGLQVGAPPDPIATFPGKHPSVGDARVFAPARRPSSVGDVIDVAVEVGDALVDEFRSFDSHLPVNQRLELLSANVVRFLEHLFSDGLFFWKSADGAGRRGWRECPNPDDREPLVLDDRTYCTFVWSRPTGTWRTIPQVLLRGRIRDDREYDILMIRLTDARTDALTGPERKKAIELTSEYERRRGD